MADIELGSKFEWLQHLITLKSVGKIRVLVGRGVVIGFGTASRGPAMELYGISKASQAYSVYRSGDLKEGLETALDQGCDVAFGYRILGDGYATAELEVNDGTTAETVTGKFTAIGPGASGNIPTITIERGDMCAKRLETFAGTSQTTPYYLELNDIHNDAAYNYVHVGDKVFSIVYTGDPEKDKVKIDQDTGALSFAAGDWPTSADLIAVRYKAYSRKITISDNDGRPPTVYNNLTSQKMIAAKLKNSNVCTYDPAYGVTHMPEVMPATNMAGGSDGAAITTEDWEKAFNDVIDTQLPGNVVATSMFTTACEVTEGTGDIVPLVDAFLWKMADKKRPLQGFVSLPADWTVEEESDFVSGYSNLWLTILANGWSASERNLAPARAGQEAALKLGQSAATSTNSMKGVDGLLFQFNDVDKRTLTDDCVEVEVKDTGVHPYLGHSTDPDENFFRCVDVRTIAEWIVMADKTVEKFYNEPRTMTNLKRLENALYQIAKTMKDASALDDFNVAVTANESDRNAVDIVTWIQPVGHMERFYHTVNVGYWSDKIAA